MRIMMALFYLVLIVVGVSFAALNAASVQVNLYVTTAKMPVSVLMAVMMGVGVCIGCFLFACRYWQLKMAFRKIKNQLKLTEKEIKNLRSIPLQDQH